MTKSPRVPVNIQQAHRIMTQKMTGEAYDCDYGEVYPDSGRYYLELHDDGKMAIVAKDRGSESSRDETYSVDELIYWMAQSLATSRAFYGWKGDYSPDERQLKYLELLGRVSPEYRARAERELVNPPPRFTIAERPN